MIICQNFRKSVQLLFLQVWFHVSALKSSPQKCTLYLISEQKLNCIQCFSPSDLQSRAPTGIKSLCLTAGKNKTPSAVSLFLLKVFSVQMMTWHPKQKVTDDISTGSSQRHILSFLTNQCPFSSCHMIFSVVLLSVLMFQSMFSHPMILNSLNTEHSLKWVLLLLMLLWCVDAFSPDKCVCLCVCAFWGPAPHKMCCYKPRVMMKVCMR